MKIIEIKPLENGAHNNSEADSFEIIPDGWAVIPEFVEIPEIYPFVFIEMNNEEIVKLHENREAYDASTKFPIQDRDLTIFDISNVLNILFED